MIRRNDVQWNHNTIYTNLGDDQSKVKLIDGDKLAIQIIISSPSEFYNGDDIRELFTISFNHSSRYYSQGGIAQYNSSPQNFDLCTEYDFKGYKTRFRAVKLNEYRYCFNLTGMEISGNLWNLDTFEYLNIAISPDVDGEITNLYSSEAGSLDFTIVTEQQYVDLGDLDKVLKPLYTTIGSTSFVSGVQTNKFSLGIEKNELNLEDNWWEIVSLPNKVKFNTIQFQGKETYHHSFTDIFFIIRIELKGQTNQFGRKVLGILEVTGVVGGIFELFDI